MANAARLNGASALWEPTFVLPSQVAHLRAPTRSPEIRLIAAMLEDAVHCVLRNGGIRRGPRWRELIEALDWVMDETRDWPFAFANVCDVLMLDAAAVREELWRNVAAQNRNGDDAKRTAVTALEEWRHSRRLRASAATEKEAMQ